MRKIVILFTVLTFMTVNALAQEFKIDNKTQLEKEDPFNQYNAKRITNVDLIEALALAGIRVEKFVFGEFDKTYNLIYTVEEFKLGHLVHTDTILFYSNEYYHWDENENMFRDYIDQVKFLIKQEDTKVTIKLKTYQLTVGHFLEYEKSSKDQFYNWRSYSSTNWKLNEKVPLLVFASSWYDSDFDSHRFCGIVDLSRNKEKTNELLTSSPHYFLFSFKVLDIEEN